MSGNCKSEPFLRCRLDQRQVQKRLRLIAELIFSLASGIHEVSKRLSHLEVGVELVLCVGSASALFRGSEAMTFVASG